MGTVSTRQSRLQTSLSMKFLVVLALIAMALAEPEADPALVYTTNTLPLTASALHTPLVYNTQALQKPLVYTAAGVHHPLVYNSASHTPLVNTPLVNTPLVYHSYGKREAEAEPEAGADPALIYTNTLPAVHSTVQSTVHSPLVYTSGLHAPVVYKTPVQTPVVYKTPVQTPVVYNSAVQTPVVYKSAVQTPVVYNSAVQTPVVYNSAVHTPVVYNTPLTTPLLSKVFPSLKTAPVVSHIAKREAEADPALLYTAGLHTPLVYNTAVHHPFVYNNLLLKTPDNAVVPTAGGSIPSSHVGVCTNNVGVRVPC